MTVPRITITHDSVTGGLNRLIAAGAEPARALDPVGRVLKTRIQQGFVTGTAPDGRPWAPLKSRAGQPLRDKGHLTNSIDYRVDGNSVEVGTPFAHAITHQRGAKIEAKPGKVLRFYVEGRPVFVKRVTIPARPIVPEDHLPDAWAKDVLDELHDVFEAAWFGGETRGA